MSDTDKDIEILTLRRQLAILQRQADKPRLTPADHALLAAPLHRLPRVRLRQLRLIVAPDTILRCHRDLMRRRHVAVSRRKLVLRRRRRSPRLSWAHRAILSALSRLLSKKARRRACLLVAPRTVLCWHSDLVKRV